MPKHGSIDRRVQKTRGLLHSALASLIHETPYDDIVVKQILARANVGRSTFYTHFRDKAELLDSGIRDTLRASMRASSRSGSYTDDVLRFSLPLFEHIGSARASRTTRTGQQQHAAVHTRLQRVLSELVAEDLRAPATHQSHRGRSASPELLAEYVASTFLVVLNWWLRNEEPLTPLEANDRFRVLAAPALREVLEQHPS